MKKLKLIILIAFILLIGSYIGYTYPRSLVKEFDGIQFRIGESDKDYSNIVKVKFDGTFSKNFIFGNTFKGDIYINDARLYEYESELKFDQYNRAFLLSDQNEFMGENLKPLMVIIDSGFNKTMISIYERNSKDVGNVSYGWSVYDGLVIAAPAKNRIEAVNITSEIIAKSLLISEDKIK